MYKEHRNDLLTTGKTTMSMKRDDSVDGFHIVASGEQQSSSENSTIESSSNSPTSKSTSSPQNPLLASNSTQKGVNSNNIKFSQSSSASASSMGTSPTKRKPQKTTLKEYYQLSKNKIVANLYNMYNTPPTQSAHIDLTEPIWLMGECFQLGDSSSTKALGNSVGNYIKHADIPDSPHIRAFVHRFYQLLWLTYRKGFPKIDSTQLTSDAGWGCMLRSAQMMLARALSCYFFTDDWILNEKARSSPYSPYRRLLRWFADNPSQQCYFSIHNMIAEYHEISGKQMQPSGYWFAPSEVSAIVRNLICKHFPFFNVYVAQDGVLCVPDIIEQCTQGEEPSTHNEEFVVDDVNSNSTATTTTTGSLDTSATDVKNQHEDSTEDRWRSCVILLPMRLGIECIHESYVPFLRSLFMDKQFIGICGGRPRQSLYFVGTQGDNAFYLDPHFVQPYQRLDDAFSDETLHTSRPQSMPLSDIDPSMVFGFYIKSRSSFDDLLERLRASSDGHFIQLKECV